MATTEAMTPERKEIFANLSKIAFKEGFIAYAEAINELLAALHERDGEIVHLRSSRGGLARRINHVREVVEAQEGLFKAQKRPGNRPVRGRPRIT